LPGRNEMWSVVKSVADGPDVAEPIDMTQAPAKQSGHFTCFALPDAGYDNCSSSVLCS